MYLLMCIRVYYTLVQKDTASVNMHGSLASVCMFIKRFINIHTLRSGWPAEFKKKKKFPFAFEQSNFVPHDSKRLISNGNFLSARTKSFNTHTHTHTVRQGMTLVSCTHMYMYNRYAFPPSRKTSGWWHVAKERLSDLEYSSMQFKYMYVFMYICIYAHVSTESWWHFPDLEYSSMQFTYMYVCTYICIYTHVSPIGGMFLEKASSSQI